MSRELNNKDIALLKKLAPELEELMCENSGVRYRSLLPPLSNHFAKDPEDFKRRLGKLDSEELKYLVDLVMNGLESLSCVPTAYLDVFLQYVEKNISKETSDRSRLFSSYL